MNAPAQKINQVTRDFFDLCIRPDVILHLGTCCTDCWPDAAREMFEESSDEVWKAMGLVHPDEEDDCEDFWTDILRVYKRHGWLVQFTTPVVRYSAKGTGSFSWGHCQIFWLYGETYEDVCEKAVAWVEKYHDEEKTKAGQ